MSFYEETLKKAAKWATMEFERVITVERLRDPSRSPTVSHPRFFAMAYMDARGIYSQPQMAAALHLEDHTSILHGLRRAHGHDGKGIAAQKEPLWKKERFKYMVRVDYPSVIVRAEDWKFKNGSGWRAA